jgi:hypothetical protein
MNYQARLIDNGQVINRATFQADNDLEAYNGAHDQTELPIGQWLEVTRIHTPIKGPDPDKLQPKTDAQRKSFDPEQGDHPKESRSGTVYPGTLPNPAGYMPGLVHPSCQSED